MWIAPEDLDPRVAALLSDGETDPPDRLSGAWFLASVVSYVWLALIAAGCAYNYAQLHVLSDTSWFLMSLSVAIWGAIRLGGRLHRNPVSMIDGPAIRELSACGA